MKFVPTIYPWLSEDALAKMEQFLEEIRDWNQKINVISRKDIDFLEERHLLPSLAIGAVCPFKEGATILDVGTGGGFPGIPLAICFPEAHFTLIDSIGKKVHVVENIIKNLGLKNAVATQNRVENINKKYDYVVARAVTALPKFIPIVKNNLRNGDSGRLRNGVLYLKGGDYSTEIEELGIQPGKIYPLVDVFQGKIETDKSIVYFPADRLLPQKKLIER
ncbi:MAG: 16S rRNA (guanine(527)-N(7))-methyltransferase RsmG [Verrucomicrobia bacterium CG_4_10_14_3_um_filter_43_23]|nr:MAG: 16S rRNA (guanine(527)-N(7))-methyltransferase RsmG [Verrucomicrobia bacterium CG1_02_43_26]PIP59130.1 MAG: 16S rRNA (guanine(527)-N(7))-methyltransferase RsmG [Verrucomicrobia bacterium CG22_combo_CG10-13_8_21_14_all_43_17]PIX57597.1 MAG: 16S rRNA (guanine(527)-N(7))-methyltransferase RsmG [Verrucomicrobia bacterium CG_4_10_14_3_um_filter_43_23]PIY62713.1 MAG: 16S rRNA (guanine(527)-N(7))-methyltransferase RsmG [Verrucomicrobia bacterium CG_4_10_14_0_8_um_filter_43_34]PJA43737.1 MAG: 1